MLKGKRGPSGSVGASVPPHREGHRLAQSSGLTQEPASLRYRDHVQKEVKESSTQHPVMTPMIHGLPFRFCSISRTKPVAVECYYTQDASEELVKFQFLDLNSLPF